MNCRAANRNQPTTFRSDQPCAGVTKARFILFYDAKSSYQIASFHRELLTQARFLCTPYETVYELKEACCLIPPRAGGLQSSLLIAPRAGGLQSLFTMRHWGALADTLVDRVDT